MSAALWYAPPFIDLSPTHVSVSIDYIFAVYIYILRLQSRINHIVCVHDVFLSHTSHRSTTEPSWCPQSKTTGYMASVYFIYIDIYIRVPDSLDPSVCDVGGITFTCVRLAESLPTTVTPAVASGTCEAFHSHSVSIDLSTDRHTNSFTSRDRKSV